MSGMDMMLSAALKAAGFSKEQFQEGVLYGKREYELIKERAISLDERVTSIENNQIAIFEILKRIEKRLGVSEVENAQIG
jgi:hypothetical protein